ncbi:hypothetical protein Tco_1407462 [Tanacetum coccineum]
MLSVRCSSILYSEAVLSLLDIYREHVVSCAGIVGIKHWHNVVRDTLVDICFRSGISSGKKLDIRLGGGRDKPLRPTDMMVDFVSGRAVIDVAQHKRIKYEAKCADIRYGFLPFSFSSFGKLDKDAVTLPKRILHTLLFNEVSESASDAVVVRLQQEVLQLPRQST